jgi:hypothetical protein
MIRDLHRACRLTLLVGLSAALTIQEDCRGGVIAADSASDPDYSDGWQGLHEVVAAEMGMDNGGFGFLPWDFEVDEGFWEPLRCPYDRPHLIDTQPTQFNDLGAPAFALTNANIPYFGYTTIATRPFAQALRVGDQLSVDIDNPVMQKLAEFDSAGLIVRLQTASGAERFGLFTTQDFNNDEWTISDSRGDETATGFTDEEGNAGFKFAFKLTGEETYQLTITPRGGGDPLTFEGTLTGTGKGELSKIQFLMFGNGSGDGRNFPTGEREFYFDNLMIESSGPAAVQKPSDCNQDGSLDISDGVCLLLRLFAGGELPCEGSLDAPGTRALLDANGDASVDISDAVWILGFLFSGLDPPVLGAHCRQIDGCPDNATMCE